MAVKTHKEILEDVFNRIVSPDTCKWYDDNIFPDAQSCPLNDNIRFPRGPGDKCYDNGVTAFRITGEDPVYFEPEAKDVPQPVIDAHRKAFMDGLRIAFPDDAVRDYLTYSMSKPAFANIYGNPAEHYQDIVKRQFPRILASKPHVENHFLHLSLEHDVDRDMQADHADMLSNPRTDRCHLTNTDLLRTYRMLTAWPEIFVSFAFWQNEMQEYAGELCAKLDVAFAKAALSGSKKEDSKPRNSHNILDFSPIFNTIFFVKNNITVSTIPLFFITAAMAGAQKNGVNARPDTPPSMADFRHGMGLALKKGIFLRRFDSMFGERQIVCPFGPFGIRWLHAEMSNKSSVLENCFLKIEYERHQNPKIDAICDGVSEAFKEILERSDQNEIQRLDALHKTARTTVHHGCPIHKTLP